jgi:hypothetical protein
MAAAYIRMGETAQARSLLMAQLSRLDWEGRFSLPLRELFALARAGEAPALAQEGTSKPDEPRQKGP